MVVKDGYKQTEVGVIPEDWEVMKFEDLTDKIIGGGTPSRSNPSFWGNEIPWVTVKDFATFNPFITQEYITKEGLQNSASHLIPKGIIITSTRMALGKAVIYDVDVSINQDLKAIYPKRIIDTKFFYYWFQFNAKYIEDMGSGSTVMGLSLPDLRKIKVKIPTLAEQTAIATALSDADALITGLEKLIVKKHNIKQGAMQQLLQPKEGWEVKTLGECLLKNPDYGINAVAVGYNDNLPTYLRITDISENGKYLTSNKASVDNVLSNSYYLEEGDIVFARTGASVGKTYLYNKNDGALVFAGFLIRVKANPEMLDYNYLFFLTQTKSYWDYVKANSMRSGQPGLNSNEYKSFEIPFPPKEEQTRIAMILSDMDAELTALEQKLGKYKKIKLGMMQELLTGKTRLV